MLNSRASVMIVLFILFSSSHIVAQEAYRAEKWEYKIVIFTENTKYKDKEYTRNREDIIVIGKGKVVDVITNLNRLGNDGWELIETITPTSHFGVNLINRYYILKKKSVSSN